MAEFVGGESISVGVDEPITFENKTDTAFDVDCGIVFRKSGLYRVSIDGRHVSVAVEPKRKKGKWINNHDTCSECGWQMIDDVTESPNMVFFNFCPECGNDMRGGEQE